MKIVKTVSIIFILTTILTGCGFFDDTKELIKQLEYYKKYAQTLEDKVRSLSGVIDTLRGENTRLKNELQRYQDAHKKMLQ